MIGLIKNLKNGDNMKIGIGTDFHLGLRQYGLEEREDDFYRQFDTMIDFFIKKEVDVVIMGGDIFDQPRPSPRALGVFTEGLQRLIDNNIIVTNIIGNHTMIQNPNFVTADEYVFHNMRDMGSGVVLLGYENNIRYTVDMDGVQIYGLPFHFDYDMDNFIQKVNELNEYAKEDDVAILVLHQAFKEFCGFTGETLSINDIDTSNFDLIVCGHIHERKLTELSNGTVFLQPGSLERSTIAEARDEENHHKGVYIIDTNEMDIMSIANGFCRIHCKRHFLIADMYINDMDDIEDMEAEILYEASHYVNAPILFLTVHDITNSFLTINEFVKDLKDDFLTVRLNYFDETQDLNELILDANDIPTVRGVLKLAFNPLDEQQSKLGIDIYENLKDGKDISGLLNDFYNKNYNNNTSRELSQDNFQTFEEWINQ